MSPSQRAIPPFLIGSVPQIMIPEKSAINGSGPSEVKAKAPKKLVEPPKTPEVTILQKAPQAPVTSKPARQAAKNRRCPPHTMVRTKLLRSAPIAELTSCITNRWPSSEVNTPARRTKGSASPRCSTNFTPTEETGKEVAIMDIPGLNVVKYKVDPDSRSVVEDGRYSLNFAGPKDTIDVTLPIHIISISRPDNGSYLEVKILPKHNYYARLEDAYRLFKQKLFEDENAVEQDQAVSRASYKIVLRQVQEAYSIKEGDPDFGEWTMLLIMKSPQFIEE